MRFGKGNMRQGKVMRSAIGLLAFVGSGAVLGWMFLVPDLLDSEVEDRTGFPFEVERLGWNPFGMTLKAYNLRLGNPEAYGEGQSFLEISELDAHVNLPAFGRGEIFIHRLDLTIPQATLVVNERGELNLDAFSNRIFSNENGSGQMPFYAEQVRLRIDELHFVDNSSLIPRRESLRVLLDVELNDLESPRELFDPMRKLASSVGSLPLR